VELVNSEYRVFFLACGAFLAWLSLLPHMRIFGPEYFAALLTLQAVFPFVTKFVVGCFPLFFGYVLFGLSFLSNHTPKFSGFGQAVVTLWSVLNGDWLYDNFQDSFQYSPVVSRLFYYTFMLLFITIISKLALASVEYIFFKAMPDIKADNQQDSHTKTEQDKQGSDGESENVEHIRILEPKKGGTGISNRQLSTFEIVEQHHFELLGEFKKCVEEMQAQYPRLDFLMNDVALEHRLDANHRCKNARRCALCTLRNVYENRSKEFVQHVCNRMEENAALLS